MKIKIHATLPREEHMLSPRYDLESSSLGQRGLKIKTIRKILPSRNCEGNSKPS